jgi:chromosome partitioning protein
MAVISLLNQKGGVGKSTMTCNLGGTLARRGRRVLVVDNDPQSSLSQGLLGPEATMALPAEATIAAIYAGTYARLDEVIRPTAFAGLDLLPGSEHAAAYNNGRPHEQPWELQTCLVEALGELAARYDHILVDCPPNLNLCSWAALSASDRVLIPVQPEDYGAQGLPQVTRSIELVRRVANPRLEVLGLVISMFSARRTLHQIYAETLRQQYGSLVFDAPLPDAAEIPEATMLRKPIAFHKPKGAAAKALVALADEFESRLAAVAAPISDAEGEAA